MSRKKIPAKAQANNLKPCPRVKVLDGLCPLELTLIAQIIPFMYIVRKKKKRCTARLKGAMCTSSGEFEKDPRNNFSFTENL